MRHLILAVTLLAPIPAIAQSAVITSGAMTATSDGQCLCSNNGKTWPCRKAADTTKPITCNLNLTYKLVCPEDKTAICHYTNAPSCSEIPIIDVCYAADEPK